MAKHDAVVRKAARLLGRRGGLATLKEYGRDQMRKWGRAGAKYGKRGGRPRKKGGQK